VSIIKAFLTSKVYKKLNKVFENLFRLKGSTNSSMYDNRVCSFNVDAQLNEWTSFFKNTFPKRKVFIL